MNNDPASTLISSADALSGAGTTIPTLTILCHPATRRIGERATLTTLALGHPAFLSRVQPEFFSVAAGEGRPLDDAHVSRTPIRCVTTRDGGIELDGVGPGVRVDGVEVTGRTVVSADRLEGGSLLELGGRVLVLLQSAAYRDQSVVGDILGSSDAIESVRREILRVADLDTPVLVRGETGVGKELVAAAIHRYSRRASGPFVAVNMATLAESVAASMLFGHAKGAFTGAQQRHRGFFERASAGTLMLDEIGETPRSVQPMLLRAIETRRILPLGDEGDRAVDVRFVAATDADLESGIEDESFSAALKHRIAGYEIHIPPLRDRPQDCPLLFVHFLLKEAESMAFDASNLHVPTTLMARLVRHSWQGNVRQLRNFARHIAIANRGADAISVTPAIERELTATEDAPRTSPDRQAKRKAADVTDDELLSALRDNGWAPGRTAAQLGIPTGTLHSLMRRCPVVRRAADVDDGELRVAYDACGGKIEAMAERLRVSPRGLVITLRQRRMLDSESA